MYSLYGAPGAASLVIHWMLLEAQLPHQFHALDLQAGEQHREDYRRVNPAGKVPTLLVDGQAMSETAAIALWLADTHPEAVWAAPQAAAERRRHLQWALQLNNGLQVNFRHWFYPGELAGEAVAEAVKETARTRIEAEFEAWNARLEVAGDYLGGAQPAMLDFYLTMLMRWSRNMPKPATEWPALAGLAERMRARPSFDALYRVEGLSEWR